MADQGIGLQWPGRGDIQFGNITPISLKVNKTKSYGKPNFNRAPKSNLIIEGDNAPVMKSLCAGMFRFRGKVDFMLWDPPYNTGNNDFIYEDNFYLTKKDQAEWKKKHKKVARDPQALDLWVKEKDASRHSKWLSFMEVRLELAKKLLKDSGVIAIHIGYQELFRLGLLMDEVFGEENRLGIINWECAYSPKNDNKGIPSTTDYVLIYAKNKDLAFRGIIPRTTEMDARYKNPDKDTKVWKSGDLSAPRNTPSDFYGIENPFTKDIHFPPKGSSWRIPKNRAKNILSEWGLQYVINTQGSCVVKRGEKRAKADRKLRKGPWPKINFGISGNGRPALKRYRDELKNEGRVLGTYWESDEILDSGIQEQFNLALSHELSGHNDGAKKLIKAVLGDDCVFNTPKPLKLTERLVQMFCPTDGIAMDAFGGSATTAHAVLSLNKQEKAKRRFIVIERGTKQYGFADTLTAERVRRVIKGDWVKPNKDTKPTGGSFIYIKSGKPISGKYILESKRDDLADIILTSHEGSVAIEETKKTKYVIGQTNDGRAIALVWDPTKGARRGHLTMKNHKAILAEVKKLKLKKPVYIYAAINAGPNGSSSYRFRQIPDEILAALEIANLTE